uniref:Uncharacterized protein n=1 Tax=Zea mays TaxID=4577 RepID=B6SJD7_MAIZE|nr:hypothetical protein [Zea mays]
MMLSSMDASLVIPPVIFMWMDVHVCCTLMNKG